MGKVDEYVIKRPVKSAQEGAQAMFITNNAKPNRVHEYGIKLFDTAAEAYAAYQRQMIAAAAGVAPPVRRMVKMSLPGRCRCAWPLCFMKSRKVMWGYQTCIAYGIGKIEVDERAEMVDNPMLITDSGVRKMYTILRRLPTDGTQRDNAPLGQVHRRSSPMKHDLHQDNLGFWRKRAVVIDFGVHIIGVY
jgi:hypothetical protein